MLGLNIITKDIELTSENTTPKAAARDKGKDFNKIFESKREEQTKLTVDKAIDDKGANNKKKAIRREEEAVNTGLETDKKELKYKANELLALINSIYGLVPDTGFELERLEGINAAEIHIGSLEMELESFNEVLQEFSDLSMPIGHEDVEKIVDQYGYLIQSLENKVEEYGVGEVEKPIVLKGEEAVSESKEIIDWLQDITNDPEKHHINYNHKEEIVELNIPMDGEEFDTTLEIKNEIPKQEEIIIDQASSSKEESKIEIVDTNPQVFETMDRVVNNTNPEIEGESIQEIDKKELFHQIVNKAKLILDENKQEIRIKLKPDILGELVLKMEIEKGAIIAKIAVDNYKTKELIEANLYQLKEDMKENGVEIKTFEVFIGTNEDFDGQRENKFNFNRKMKKARIINNKSRDIESYDQNLAANIQMSNYDGQLNLLA
ncbi:MAG: flagellar hook-length control protein FliK [Tissierellia bacterium]|nr:flagellar hook-length control protein FliK [Tissierellia bacterium]